MTAEDRRDDRDVLDATSAETTQPGPDYGNVGGQDPAEVEQAHPDDGERAPTP